MTAVQLTIQRYLRAEGTLDTLARDYAVKSVRHDAHPHLVLLKYDQIASPMEEPLVRECRGIVVDEADDWRVVGRGFDKFFNYGEPNAAEIDWSTARVQEKVDGTLCLFYHYKTWHVATTGFPDARGRANLLPMTFGELIWQTADEARIRLLSPEHSYLFELTSPHTRVVVQHSETRLTLLAIRHTPTGCWVPLSEAAGLLTGNVDVVREYPLNSFAAIQETFASLDPLAQEGYVVVDGDGNRVKVKHPRYVAIHHLMDSSGPRRYVEMLRSGETPELLTYFPELESELAPVRTAYEALQAEIDADYARLKEIDTQKEFALEALKTRCSAALFAIRAGQCASATEYLARRAQLPYVLRLLGVKEESAAA